MTERKKNNMEERSKIETFTVPFDLDEISKNIIITSKNPSKPSKEQIINQALKFHSEGNVEEAAKYYQYFIDQGFRDNRFLIMELY